MADHHTEDTKVLHSMGYAQELARRMSGFSNFAISFSIICILSGGINSFAQATGSIGGAGAGIGWIVGCVVSGFFALCMAQIASSYPTAGGLYHWGSILGNRFTGWVTAWLNLLGLITVLGAINIGTAFFFQGTFGSMIGMTADPVHIVLFVAVITVIQALINHLGISLTAKLTDFSGYLILGTTAAMIILLLIFAPTHDITRLWTFTNNSGETGGNVFPQSDNMLYLFSLCLLLPIYTITGYDASAHTSEETKQASTSVPRSIVQSVIISSLAGWVLLSVIMMAIPDMAEGAKQGWSVFFATMTAVLPGWLVTLLYLLILIAQLICGLATVTSASRMIFAFSRDGGLPLISKALANVSVKYRTPVAAIWAAAIAEFLFVWLAQTVSIGGTNIYTIVVNATLIFLFLSFTIPIALGFFAIGTEKWPKMGPWNMGVGMYKLFAVLSVLGMILIVFIAIQPPNANVLWITLAFLVLAAILWVVFENKRFMGPPVGDAIAKRQAEIAAVEAKYGHAE
ncbi:amino acid permease [Devosia sp.]|uniref:amino acid permease n=1 Tax=Devosia sp. TaxID=1871048 RepID=UPI003BA8CE51